MELIPYIEVSNTVSLITTTLSSGVGFVIGYYFKLKFLVFQFLAFQYHQKNHLLFFK